MPRKDRIKDVRRIVVKIGTSLITEDGVISTNKIARLVVDIMSVIKKGCEVVVVSSGAISAGAGALKKSRESKTIPEMQALAAVGQTVLMNEYQRCFFWEGKAVGQILLTEDDVNNRRRFLNARHTFNTLLEMGIVPIVNENDSVVIKEIKFGDNDTLSAHVANIVEADLLVILSNVDGFYMDMNDKAPLEEINQLSDEIWAKAGGKGDIHSTGGMITKLKAVEILMHSGEMTIIANGKTDGVLQRIMSGEKIGTLFAGTMGAMKSRKRWIAFNMKSSGTLVIDEGAIRALNTHKKSLLATGIIDVQGKFDLGDAVNICDAKGALVGKGIVNYNCNELVLIKGKKTSEIRDILGGAFYDEVINRDDLIIYNRDKPVL